MYRVIRPRDAVAHQQAELAVAPARPRQARQRQRIHRDGKTPLGAQAGNVVVRHLQRDRIGGVGVAHRRPPTERGVAVVDLRQRRAGRRADEAERQCRRQRIGVGGGGGQGHRLAHVDGLVADRRQGGPGVGRQETRAHICQVSQRGQRGVVVRAHRQARHRRSPPCWGSPPSRRSASTILPSCE